MVAMGIKLHVVEAQNVTLDGGEHIDPHEVVSTKNVALCEIYYNLTRVKGTICPRNP